MQTVGFRAAERASGHLIVKAITITRSGARPWRAYNLTIAADHTYFVGRAKAWVHNACGEAIWSSGRSGSGVKNALGHWKKHRSDFPNINNAKQYVDFAYDFFANPPLRTLRKIRASDGRIVMYNKNSNTFAVYERNGTPVTIYKPSPWSPTNPSGYRQSSPLAYYNAQN